MLLIIGLLGCVYLLVKSCEFTGSSAYRTEEGWLKPAGWTGAALSIVGAIGFTVWLFIQSSEVTSSLQQLSAPISQ